MKSLVFVSLCFLFLTAFSVAQFQVPAYQGYVTDYAGVFSDTDTALLTEKITQIKDRYGAEIAVLFVPSINNDNITFAATQVGQDRGVGDKDKDTGLVVLVAVEDRQWFVAVGYGLEGVMPDAIAKRIADARFIESFRAGQYAQGLGLFLDDVQGYMDADSDIRAVYDVPEGTDDTGLWIFAVLIALGFMLTVWFSKASATKKFVSIAVWLGLIVLLSLVFWTVVVSLLYVSFFGLFVMMKSLPGVVGSGRGGFGGMSGGKGGFGGGGSFGGGGFGGGGAGGRR